MRRKQFSEDQIVRILEEFESGKSVEDAMGISCFHPCDWIVGNPVRCGNNIRE